jgi:fumarate reductase subunit C
MRRSADDPRGNAPIRGGGYRRSMDGWWRRNPYFFWYMVREITAVGVAAYALVLLAGVVCLAAGEAAWNGWLAAMKSPLSIALHVALLVGMLCHAWSWFDIMPKTMPLLFVGGRRVASSTITRAGWIAAALTAAALFALAWVLRR